MVQNKPGKPADKNGKTRPQNARAPKEYGPGFLARAFAADTLTRVIKERRSIEEAMHMARPYGLSDADFGLARAIVTVVFRRMGTIRHAIGSRLSQGGLPDAGNLNAALLVGAAQILFMDVPDHAAVDVAVELTKSDKLAAHYAPLANAILRKLSKEKAEILAEPDAIARDVPEFFRERWARFYGEDAMLAMAQALISQPHIDLTAMGDAHALQGAVGGTLLSTGSLRLSTDQPVTSLPGYEDGSFQVQDVASALPARLIGAKKGMRVLDLCAAPGGKTAQLCAAGADVVAVERSAQRAERLKENLARLKLTAEIVIADASDYTAPAFDAVLLDAPCSATGTIRRHPEIAWTKTLADVIALARQQGRLLAHAATLVKPGGVLVYATCSLEPEEGEKQIGNFLVQNTDFKRMPIEPEALGVDAECITSAGMLRVLPSHFAAVGGADGFFAARLQRIG